MIFYLQFIRSAFQSDLLEATISFDEGPSKNIPAILEILDEMQVPASFYLDPSKINDDTWQMIIAKGHYLGLAIVDDLSDLNANEVEQLVQSAKEVFKLKTKQTPKLVRLPRIGYTKETEDIAKKLGLQPTKPNLDSEDCDLANFMEPYTNFVKNANENLSVCFRDRMSNTVKNLRSAIQVLFDSGYEIVSGNLFYGVEDDSESWNRKSAVRSKCSGAAEEPVSKLSSLLCPSQICTKANKDGDSDAYTELGYCSGAGSVDVKPIASTSGRVSEEEPSKQDKKEEDEKESDSVAKENSESKVTENKESDAKEQKAESQSVKQESDQSSDKVNAENELMNVLDEKPVQAAQDEDNPKKNKATANDKENDGTDTKDNKNTDKTDNSNGDRSKTDTSNNDASNRKKSSACSTGLYFCVPLLMICVL